MRTLGIKVKTTSLQWADSPSGVIVPFSIHSKFHEGFIGLQKVCALIERCL